MQDEYRFRRIGARTAIYGVLGKPVSHSVSPAMHNAAFRAAHLDAVYLPLAASDFDDFTAFADAVGLAGASVTAPFKVNAFERADECDPVSRRIQSVNTLRREGSKWLGCNTDVTGFLAPLESAMRLRGARATVLGAGGAARSVSVALASAGVKVTIAARRDGSGAGRRGADRRGDRRSGRPIPASWDLLVNATPVGTAPTSTRRRCRTTIPFTAAASSTTSSTTRRRRGCSTDAARAGCRTIGGLDMLVAQAQAQFEWWTGGRPADRVMRDAALARLRMAAKSAREDE